MLLKANKKYSFLVLEYFCFKTDSLIKFELRPMLGQSWASLVKFAKLLFIEHFKVSHKSTSFPIRMQSID